MHRGLRVVLVVPALDEEASVGHVVASFRAQDRVDEVLVVDNGSHDRTAERAMAAGARVLHEPRRGYGCALRAGIEQALAGGAGLVVLTEADGTFAPEDLALLLAPLPEVDLVLGSRHADLSGPLRLGNRLVARILAGLWSGRACRLTDVGCTYRAFTAEAWSQMRAGARAPGPEFSPQMMGAAFQRRLRVREVPVRYGARGTGASKHGGSTLAVARTALRMLAAILAQRVAAARGPLESRPR